MINNDTYCTKAYYSKIYIVTFSVFLHSLPFDIRKIVVTILIKWAYKIYHEYNVIQALKLKSVHIYYYWFCRHYYIILLLSFFIAITVYIVQLFTPLQLIQVV